MNCPSTKCAYGVLTLFALVSPLHATPPQTYGEGYAMPHIFDTVALRVAKTPYDSRWRKAWAGSRGPSAPLSLDRTAIAAFSDLAIVHNYINDRIEYRVDLHGRDTADNWATAAKTLARGYGDCEDFAIAKGQELLSLGFRPKDLYLVIGKARRLNSYHAILVVRSGGKFWVLDNLSSEVVDAAQVRNFDPIITLSADRKWVHGYEKGARERNGSSMPTLLGRPPATTLSAVKLAQTAIRLKLK